MKGRGALAFRLIRRRPVPLPDASRLLLPQSWVRIRRHLELPFPLLIRMSTRAAQFIEFARLDRWGAVRVCVFASCQLIVLQG
jgi:hypothetical protein